MLDCPHHVLCRPPAPIVEMFKRTQNGKVNCSVDEWRQTDADDETSIEYMEMTLTPTSYDYLRKNGYSA